MAKTETEVKALNVYQKLILARKLFLETGVEKSGKNIHLEYKYFSLEDIVPVATKIFEQVGLVSVISFTNEVATLTLYNCDKPEENIVFTSPMREIPAIVNKSGQAVSNPIQLLGSAQTYLRRYLYLTCLDIVEYDEIEENVGNESKKPKATNTSQVNKPVVLDKNPKVQKPASVEERQEIKEQLVNNNEKATPLQITSLKKCLKALIELNPNQSDMVNQIVAKTNKFENITQKQCEDLITNVNSLIEELKHE